MMLNARRARLLSTMTVAEIASSLALDDPASFTRAFNRHADCRREAWANGPWPEKKSPPTSPFGDLGGDPAV